MLVLALSTLTGCGIGSDNRYQLGQYDYCLPEGQGIFQYGVTTPRWTIPGADINDQPTSFMLDFPAEDIHRAIPAYQLFDMRGGSDLLFARVRRPGKDYIHDFLRRPSYRSVLDLSGDEQYVSYDKQLNIYRVSQLPIEQSILWTNLTIKPEKGRKAPDYIPDFVQGGCVRDVHYGASCNADVGIDDYLIDLQVPEVNLHLQQALAEFVVAKLNIWEQACEN